MLQIKEHKEYGGSLDLAVIKTKDLTRSGYTKDLSYSTKRYRDFSMG